MLHEICKLFFFVDYMLLDYAWLENCKTACTVLHDISAPSYSNLGLLVGVNQIEQAQCPSSQERLYLPGLLDFEGLMGLWVSPGM